MIQTSAVIVIHQPISKVFSFAANLSNIPSRILWNTRAQVRPLSTGPFGDGTQFEETVMSFGRAFTSVLEVTNYRVNEGFDFQTIKAPFPILSGIGGLRFSATADGTRVTHALQVRLVPWLRPFEPLLQRRAQAQSQRIVQAMKTILDD